MPSHRALLETRSEPEQMRNGKCRLSSGCMPPAESNADTPGWAHEMARITLMVTTLTFPFTPNSLYHCPHTSNSKAVKPLLLSIMALPIHAVRQSSFVGKHV